jgi:Zn-dependent protease
MLVGTIGQVRSAAPQAHGDAQRLGRPYGGGMRSGPTFRIAGIPVRVDPSFLLIALFLGFGARSGGLLVAWVVIVFASVLLHELGHAVAFRRYGQEPSILLQGMGGLTSGSGEALPPRRDVVVSLAGPLTGLVLLGLPALWLTRNTSGLSSATHTILTDVVFVNIAWSVVNLLPVLPLDGGRVSAALWALRTGGEGRRQAHVLSVVVAAAGGLFALAEGYPFGAIFAGFFAAYNVSQLSAARNAELQQQLLGGWRALSRADHAAAASAAEAVLADRPSAVVMGQAMELLAWARLSSGDAEGARAAVERFPHGRAPDPFLLAALALDAGRSDDALDLLSRAYAHDGAGPAAPVVADAVVRAGLDRALVDRLLAPGGPGPSAVARFSVQLHAARRFTEAAAAGRRALDAGSAEPGRVAYDLACSHARAGQADAALEWLERAAKLGFVDGALLDTDPDLRTLHGDPRYERLRDRLRPS